jgi:hypothetical protein
MEASKIQNEIHGSKKKYICTHNKSAHFPMNILADILAIQSNLNLLTPPYMYF